MAKKKAKKKSAPKKGTTAPKKGTKKKVAKKKAVPKTDPQTDPQKAEVPKSIRERAARNLKRKAEYDKEQKAKEKKIPEGAIHTVREGARSKARITKGLEKDKFSWIEILTGEIIRLSQESRALKKRIEKLEKDGK